MPKRVKTYDEVEKLVISELVKFKHGEIIQWCKKYNFPQAEIARLKHGKLKSQRPFFLKEILEALGYTDINVSKVTYIEYETPKKQQLPTT